MADVASVDPAAAETVIVDNEEDESKEILLMKQRVEEMEREAKKLRELQAAAESSASVEQAEGDESMPMETEDEKALIDSRSVFVGNVDYSATAEDIQAHFQACGTINRITILCDKFTGHPKGFAYVEFAEPEFIDPALALDNSLFHGRLIKARLEGEEGEVATEAGTGVVIVVEEEDTVPTGAPVVGTYDVMVHNMYTFSLDGHSGRGLSRRLSCPDFVLTSTFFFSFFNERLFFSSSHCKCTFGKPNTILCLPFPAIAALCLSLRQLTTAPPLRPPVQRKMFTRPLHAALDAWRSASRRTLATSTKNYPYSQAAIIPPAPADAPPAAIRKGKGLMAYLQQTLPSTEKQQIIHTLFSRTHPERVRPGSVLTVNLAHAPTTFSGVLISVRRRGPDTSFVLRNVVQRTGVEMQFFANSPHLKEIVVVSRAGGKDGKKKRLEGLRKAKLFYLRDSPERMTSVATGVRR
ncbi:hypothetical protein EDB92DRAFT_2081439 [Lactarius akahatsu]|uniref:RRM domain-containing protein n=1 Tax=Lactarius akahatsu TaxID=416441 RepID=A0AAD4LU68_9AGAM|nr:hypothetical protein EDB92DRAFT_2081439 [Lactarius akahatsu]